MNMTLQCAAIVVACSSYALGHSARADQIVQKGSLSGVGSEPIAFTLVLDQFDAMGGARQLNFVQIDTSTSVIGGYEPWIGPSAITLEAIAPFGVSEDPTGHIFFGASGGASYSIPCDFEVLPDVVGDLNGDGIDPGMLLSQWTL